MLEVHAIPPVPYVYRRQRVTIAMNDLKWYQFRKKVINWQNKRRSDQNSRVDHDRERSISVLQKRYGFDRDKAISELDRYYSRARLG